jgi:hypothetical protein
MSRNGPADRVHKPRGMNKSQKVFATAWLILVGVTFWGSGFPQLASFDPLEFPKDFRTWTHTTTISNENGYHEVFVNSDGKAAGTRHGIYPDGARIVVASYAGKGENLRGYTLMMKDSILFSKTDGWGFAGFTPEYDRVDVDAASRDYIFSTILQ